MSDRQSALFPDVGDYVSALVHEPLPVLAELREYIAATSEEPIYIHPTQARLLEILLRMAMAKRVLELGTHLGYSAIWLASACTNGARIETIEKDPERFRKAKVWIDRSGVSDRITQVLGDAIEVMRGLESAVYDLVFIDANKTGYPELLTEAVRCVRTGGLIVADNTLHKCRVAEKPIQRETTRAIDEYNHASHGHPQLVSVLVPLGDGLTISIRVT